MHYDHVITGTFIDCPNRFIANCEISDPDTGQKVVSRYHLKNTGRSVSSPPHLTIFFKFNLKFY